MIARSAGSSYARREPFRESIAVPRAFISYSWSSLTHESWVVELATRLREDGIDVILDKWDLTPGDDAHAFMESMVTDPTVEKVLLICDEIYTKKANSRAGGVGTESQIISAELYGRSSQDKFAALVTDEDDDGKPHIPVFYKGRIYFDFRSSSNHEDSYDKLIRWFHNKPLHVKPQLGKLPDHLFEASPIATGTLSKARRAEEAIRQSSPNAHALIREYGGALIDGLRGCAPIRKPDQPFDDAVIASIACMRPYFHQFVDLVEVVIHFSNADRDWDRILDIIEQIGRMMFRAESTTNWNTDDFDSYMVTSHEIFLSTVASALDAERFELVEAALNRRYLVDETSGGSAPSTSSFTVFRQYPESLEARNQRLKLGRVDLQADLLEQTHKGNAKPPFDSLLQADFILFLRSWDSEIQNIWYPLSLIYATNRYRPFPLFARAESQRYLERLAPILGEKTPADVKERISRISQSDVSRRMLPRGRIPVSVLSNLDHLGIGI